MKVGLWLLLFGGSAAALQEGQQVCSADGVCRGDDGVVIPRAANAEGAAPELATDCADRHPNCAQYHRQDQCAENPGEAARQ
jgi:hypothetical protein